MSKLGVQELAQTERSTFDQMSRAYDKGEYVKAIRHADAILRAKPEHGETMCMKGLSIHSLLNEKTKKEEKGHTMDQAYELVKGGLMKNMKSALCWHALAMMYRSDHQYQEALKAYKRSHVLDSASGNILRDMSTVALQLKDWDTFLECRNKLLGIKQNNPAHWLGVAVAYILQQKYDLASAVLDAMVATIDVGDTPAELQEVQLLRAETALRAGHPKECLKIIHDHEKLMIDFTPKLLLKAEAHTAMGQKKEAEECHVALMKEGVEDHDSVMNIAKLRKISVDRHGLPVGDKDTAAFLDLIDNVALKANPKSDYCKRLKLDLCPLSEFKAELEAYCTRYISKNIPSLFSVLKSIYVFGCQERINIVGETFLQFEAELSAAQKEADGEEGKKTKVPSSSRFGPLNPTHILWVWTFLSSHYSRIGVHAKAHEYIEKAIQHSPTIEMLYLHRAKIHRREGNLEKAVEDAELARKLDLQDKYMNTKAAKYMLRAGEIDRAEEKLGMFFKESEVNDHYLQLFDSQTLWYEREVGMAFFAKGDYYSALQCFLLYEKHRHDDHEGVMDFHQYCIRTIRVRAWLEWVTREIVYPGEKFFLFLCPHIVRTYLKVHELGAEKVMAAHVPRPELPPTKDAEDNATRVKRIQDFVLKVDLTSPLEKAGKYVEALKTHRPQEVETHQVAYEYHRAKEQPLGCVKAVVALQHIAKHQRGVAGTAKQAHATLLPQFKAWEKQDGSKWPAPVNAAIKTAGL